MEGEKAGTGLAALPDPQTDQPADETWKVWIFGANPNRTLFRVVLWGILLVGAFHHVFLPIQIIGSSMSPTYQNGTLNFINRLSYSGVQPERGDVIALRSEDELLLKRIVGLPGETVSIERGQIKIDGRVLVDNFSTRRVPWEMDPVQLADGEYFVIGDNRSSSVFGKVARAQILGRVVF